MAFQTQFGHFEILVMLLGLTNALVTFMTLINSVLHPYLGKILIVFIDDILIHSASNEEHLHHL